MSPRRDEAVDRLYRLIPEVYRSRDVEHGGALRALVAVIAEQHDLVERNLDELYDNAFIETCAEWAVPYIGELIGCEPLYGRQQGIASRRAEVANTIRYRRRKGTLAMLRGLLADVTGWGIEVEERINALAAYHAPDRRVPAGTAHPDVRRGGMGAKRADVRRIASGYGGYGLTAVAVRAWRIDASAADGEAAAPSRPQERRQYFFHPAGVDTPLFSEDDDGISRPITRAGMRRRVADFVGVDKAIRITLGGRVVAGDEVEVADLAAHEGATWAHRGSRKHLLDPERGRLVLAEPVPAPPVVGFFYGCSADIGGGSYDRGSGGVPWPDKPSIERAQTFDKPLKIDHSRSIELPSGERIGGRVEVHLAAGRQVHLRAAQNARAVIAATDFTITGEGLSELVLDGLLVAGTTLRVRGAMARLRVVDCTFTPRPTGERDDLRARPPSIVVESGVESVEIERTVFARIETDRDTRVRIVDSIVDAGAEHHVAVGGTGARPAGGVLTLLRSTVLGQVRVAEIETIADSIVAGVVAAERRVRGTVRFSYLRAASRVPERVACVTDGDDDGFMRPHFISRRYGNPAYFRLADYCSERIRRGAEDESEMGVYHDSSWTILDARLRKSLADSLPFHAAAGIIYAS